MGNDEASRPRNFKGVFPADAGRVEGPDTGPPTTDRNGTTDLPPLRPLFFDISDLLAYFPYNRTPTGIQRVQVEMLTSLIAGDLPVRLCRFEERANRWTDVPILLFSALLHATRTGSDALDQQWLELYRRVDGASMLAASFAPGSILVNLGSSWWLPNYFLQVRDLQARHGVTYVPLIYDMIPVIAPSYCTPMLTREFIEWLHGLLYHSDFYLAISEATKRDLIATAAALGKTIDPASIEVVPLDGNFRDGAVSGIPPHLPARLIGQPFVMLVSTIDLRKNQLTAFAAWRELVNRHGAAEVPFLILVGRLGFKGDEILAHLSRDETLASRVIVLTDVDDRLLAELYRTCLFTVYPSNYEGWGLPVTESLTYGKVALTAANSSLVEAGAGFAVFFQSGSIASLVTELERLIFENGYRTVLEQKIAASFVPRTWMQVTQQLGWAIKRLSQGVVPNDRSIARVERGGFYAMQRGTSSTLWSGMGSAEICRSGTGWYELERGGTRTRPGGGDLALRIAGSEPVRVALQIYGLPTLDTDILVYDDLGTVLATARLDAARSRWITLIGTPRDCKLHLTLSSSESEREELDQADAEPGRSRMVGAGLAGIFLLAADDSGQAQLIEALALNNLNDYNAFRRRS